MSILERLRGGLIVSVQAERESLLATTQVMTLFARVAERNGAGGIRAEGIETLRSIRAAVALPLIGIVKRVYPGFAPYITPTVKDAEAIAKSGVDIVAFDATNRMRPDGASLSDMVEASHRAGALAMADCSTAGDARAAAQAQCDIVATTLAGYTDETRGRPLPAVDIVSVMRREHGFVVCEGGIASPQLGREALEAGASAIVVGSAITNLDALVRSFLPSGHFPPEGGSA
ncbi:MAG: N-acetylmannosamine-6-phosphate 2-epimerase [Candidatus Eremiobacteraeota bacterium]|nr:N-acetylmannosamine-6-phosphate 2-epimerase [Candidatus Eremiobacteraeota bacterium]MBV9647052.1 N-acetylmannosamine-6-phosphate 2-epimerase [Candidatus Eremiobacteraeota bacterium]